MNRRTQASCWFAISPPRRVRRDRIWSYRNMKVKLGGVCLLTTGLTIAFTARSLGEGGVAAGGATPSTLVNATSQQQLPASPPASAQRALVDRYCVTCHNQRLK